jgi:hypothetical protein
VSLTALPRPHELPRRDDESREQLARAALRAQPLVLAGERVVPVAGPLGALLPGGGVQRGAVVKVDGAMGAGATTVALQLAAAATAAGEWAAGVELDVVRATGSLGGLAAHEAGVALERFALVRRVPPARWAAVLAALIDGVGLVVAEVPVHARGGDARRLAARARERGVVLVALGAWPAEAALRVRVEGSAWTAPALCPGLLGARELRVSVDGRGAVARSDVAIA